MRRASQVDDAGKHLRWVEVLSVDAESVATVRALNGPLRGSVYTVAYSALREVA